MKRKIEKQCFDQRGLQFGLNLTTEKRKKPSQKSCSILG